MSHKGAVWKFERPLLHVDSAVRWRERCRWHSEGPEVPFG